MVLGVERLPGSRHRGVIGTGYGRRGRLFSPLADEAIEKAHGGLAVQFRQLREEGLLVFQAAQVELETAVLDPADDGNRQRAKRRGEPGERRSVRSFRAQHQTPAVEPVDRQRPAAGSARPADGADPPGLAGGTGARPESPS